MAIHYRYNSSARLVFADFVGQVSDAELLAHARELLADPALDAGPAAELADLSDADLSGLSQGGLRNVAAVLAGRACLDRLALYAPRDLPFGLARMFEVLASDADVEVKAFRDADTARAWVGLTPPGDPDEA